MKIELQSPFLEYKSGYLVQNKEPRNLIVLIRKDNTKTSISFARYLMSCHLNRFLEKYEHVDHIDGNKLNDTIENLQILSQLENNRKYLIQNNKIEKIIELICPICKSVFHRKSHNVQFKINEGKIPTCSKKCGGIMSHLSKQKNF